MDTLNVLSVGISGGSWGMIQADKFVESGFVVGAVLSRSQEKAEALASTLVESLKIVKPLAFSSEEEFCSADTIDLVSCNGHPFTRKRQALVALEAGKHILVDKPMGANAHEAVEILRAYREARDRFPHLQGWMDFELRAVPAIRRVRRIVHAKVFGEVESMEVYGNLPGLFDNPAKANSWMARKSEGGGVWTVYGAHAVDLARFLLGAEVSRVRAVTRSGHRLQQDVALPDVGDVAHGEMHAVLEMNAADAIEVKIHAEAVARDEVLKQWVNLVFRDRTEMKIDLRTSQLIGGETDSDRIAMPSEEHNDFLGRSSMGCAFVDIGTPALFRAVRGALQQGNDQVIHSDSKIIGGAAADDVLAALEDGVLVQRVIDAVMKSAEAGGGLVDVDNTPP